MTTSTQHTTECIKRAEGYTNLPEYCTQRAKDFTDLSEYYTKWAKECNCKVNK